MNRVPLGWSVYIWVFCFAGAKATPLTTGLPASEALPVREVAEQLPECNGLDMVLGSLARPCIRYDERYYDDPYRGIEEKPRHPKPKRTPPPPKFEGPIAPSYKEPQKPATPAGKFGIDVKPEEAGRAGQDSSTGTGAGESGVSQFTRPAPTPAPTEGPPHEEIHDVDPVESAASPTEESPQSGTNMPAKESKTDVPAAHGILWVFLLLAITAVGSLKANVLKEKLALWLEKKRNLIIRKKQDKREARGEEEDRVTDQRSAGNADASGEEMRRNEKHKQEQQQRQAESKRREEEKRRQEQQQRQSSGGDDGPMTVDDAFAYFGLAKGCTEAEFQTVYREKIRNNHPDQHAKVDPDIFQIIEARAKRINQAAQLIKKYHGWK